MTQGHNLQNQQIRRGTLAVSFLGVLLPALSRLLLPDALSEPATILWLAALLPTFVLGYWRGLRGALFAIGIGLATIAVTETLGLLLMGRPPSLFLPWVVAIYVVIGGGVARISGLLHQERETIRGLALTDNLTLLPNRRHARDFLEAEFAAAKRGRLLSVVLFDLDRFKSFNDLHGHRAGDRALERFGELLASTTRRMDLSGRFGGEEFLTVLPGSDEAGAVQFADRVREGIEAVRLTQGSITVSAGVATFHPSMRSPDELIAAADLALYRAKRDGRNCVRVFGRTLETEEEETPTPSGTSDQPDPGGEGTSQGLQALPEDGSDEATTLPSGVTYPRADEEIGKSPPEAGLLPPASTGIGSGRSIWLVEEEDDERGRVASYLAGEGFTVEEATHASDVEPLEREFDIVIAGGGPDGPGAREWLMTLKSRWPATQVIGVAADAPGQRGSESRAGGADRLLVRPYELVELRSHLTEALARRDHLLEAGFAKRMADDGAPSAGDARSEILAGARSLMRAVEMRDRSKEGHASRVGAYAEAILRAARSGLGDIEPEALRLACELHDIGEIGVPEEVLNKREPLTPPELEMIRRHPLIGIQILEPLLANETVLTVTRHHHERWDGSGYPDGLAGLEIPVSARIVSLASSLDAMTSPRPYRDALPWNSAVDQVLALGGQQFDPELLDPFQLALPELTGLHESKRTDPSGG